MVLTDRQRTDLHSGIYEYLLSRPGDAFAAAAAAVAAADPDACGKDKKDSTTTTPLLEKKWTAVPRLQKKVLELERAAAQSAKIHAHRVGVGLGGGSGGGVGGGVGGGAGGSRRMIPRPPAAHTLKGHQGVVSCVAVHPVYTVAVSGSEDGTVKVWDHESGDYVRTLKGHTNTVHSVAFTSTGSHLASASSDLSIKLWDFTTYACVRTLRGHDHTISCVRFVPAGAGAATAAASSSTIGSPTAGTAANDSSSTTTGISPTISGSTHLISASRDATVKFWDVESGFCVHTLSDHTDWVRTVSVRESDGTLMATGGNDTVVYVYRTDGRRDKVCELRGHDHVVEGLSFVVSASPAAAAGGESSSGGGGEGSVSKLDATGSSSNNKKSSESRKADELNDLLASCGRDRTVRLWSVSAASCLAVFDTNENWVRSVLVHPSGNFVISCGDDRSIRVFDVKSKRCLRTIDNAHPHFVTSIAMHHTLPILVSGGVDQTVKCWQLD